MEMIRLIRRGYHVFNEEWADPRSKNLWIMSSPWPMLGLVFSYVVFTRTIGPRLMKDRKPLRIERVVQAYNLVQIVSSIYVFYKALQLGWATQYNWRCEPIDRSWSPHALEIVSTVHLYFVIKVVDLIDTLFFILRKKATHLSFLHVYHHGGMVVGSWVGAKYFPGGHVTFLGMINSFVHAVMYTYYLMTSLNPDVKRNVWWKKHITQMQMVQFLMIAVHSSQLFFSNPCNYPLLPPILMVPQNFFMFFLFYDFYRKAYMRKKVE